MINKQTVLNIALMVIIIIMAVIIVMQNEQTCPVVEPQVCPEVKPCVCNTTVETVYIENKTCISYKPTNLVPVPDMETYDTKTIEKMIDEQMNFVTPIPTPSHF